MGTDAQWFWSSDYGRDKLLRQELEAQAVASSSANARLRSQLAKVQGSLDQRLTALTRAFDAYVELGDVRDELSRLPSSIRVRERARGAMSTLRSGLVPEPITDDGSGHWLAPAMNRVIAEMAGKSTLDSSAGLSGATPASGESASGEAASGESATGISGSGPAVSGTSAGEIGDGAADPGTAGGLGPSLSSGPDEAVFIAAALAELGRGAVAADLLPRLLITDGGFTAEQVVLFTAAVRDRFGPSALAGLRDTLTPSLASTAHLVPPDPDARRRAPEELPAWPDWLSGRTRSSASNLLAWVLDRTTPLAVAQPLSPEAAAGATPIDVAGYDPSGRSAQASTDVDAQLRTLVDQLIDEGSPQERDLLRRATELRARIENPGAAVPPTRWGAPPVPVTAVVRAQLSELPSGAPAAHELFRWILPLVQPAIDAAMADEPAKGRLVPVRATAAGTVVDVTATGPVPDSRAAARQTLETRHAREPWSVPRLVAAGAALGLGVLVLVLTGGSAVWALVVAALVAAALVGSAVWQHRLGDRPALLQADLAELDQAVDRAERNAKAAQEARDQAQAEHVRLVALVTEQLEAARER